MIDRERIDGLLADQDACPEHLEVQRQAGSGLLVYYDGPTQPFVDERQGTWIIGYDDDRDRILHTGAIEMGGLHIHYAIRQSSLVNAFEPDDRFDGEIWIGDAPADAEVLAIMAGIKHTYMFSAVQTWMVHASIMLESIPESESVPSSLGEVLAKFNRRFAAGVGA